MFLDQIFVVSNFSSENFFKFRISTKLKQTIVFIRQNMNNISLFRRSITSNYEICISQKKVLFIQTFRDWLTKLRKIVAMKASIKSYSFRRDNEERFDSSNKHDNFFVNSSLIDTIVNLINESQRNLILQHVDFIKFQKNYLSKYITSDVQIVRRDLMSQTILLRKINEMSRTIDRRRSRKLSSTQKFQMFQEFEVRVVHRRIEFFFHSIKNQYRIVKKSKKTKSYDEYQQAFRRLL